PDGDAAIHFIAARFAIHAQVCVWIETPDFLAGLCIERIGLARGAGCVHHAIDDDRSGFEAASGVRIVVPCEAELIDILLIDLIERRIIALAEVPAAREPFSGVLVSRKETFAVNLPGTIGLFVPRYCF